jgi:predicted nucleic acid-binding protein
VKAYLDATVLIALGSIGELDRLSAFDVEPVVLPGVRGEVTTQPALTALDRAVASGTLDTVPEPSERAIDAAMTMLGETEPSADVHLTAAIWSELDADRPAALVSDDRRLRTVTRGLGATVTGTIGVVVRAVDEGVAPEEAKAMIRRLDDRGLHMTASLRERADEFIDEAGR